MSQSRDPRMCDKLHAYELGLLAGDELDTFETHLLECDQCRQEALAFEQTTNLLKSEDGVGELARELDPSVTTPDEAAATAAKPRRGAIYRIVVGVAAVLVILLLKPWTLEFRPDQTATAAEDRILTYCLPGSPADSAAMDLSTVIGNLLITDLSQSRFVRVVSGTRLEGVLRELGRGDTTKLSETLLIEAARETQSRWALLASLQTAGTDRYLTAQLIEVSSGDVISSARWREDGGDLISLVDSATVFARSNLILPTEAKDEFDPAVADVTTHSAEAYRHYLRGLDYYGKLYFIDAERCFFEALKYDSTFAMAYFCLAYTTDPAYNDKAMQYSDGATRAERLYIRSYEAQRSGDYDRCAAILENLVAEYPEEKVAWMELASMAETRGDYGESVRLLRQALAVDSLYKDAYYMLAPALSRTGDFEAALEAADTYIRLVPEEPNPYVIKGRVLAANGRPGEAISYFEQAIAIKRDFLGYDPLRTLGRLLVFAGETEQARALFREAATNGSPAVRTIARVEAASVDFYRGDLSACLAAIDEALTADSAARANGEAVGPSSLIWFARSRVLAEAGEFKQAVAAMTTAIDQAETEFPNDRSVYRGYYAYHLAQAGEFETARKVADSLGALSNPTVRELATRDQALGLIAFVQNDYSAAAEHLAKLIGTPMEGFAARYFLGRAYLETGQTEQAADMLEQAMTNHLSSFRLVHGLWAADAHYRLGLAYEELGKTEEAAGQYRLLVEAWSQCSAVLRPLVRDAEERQARLTS